ncbi:4-hydroxythreonine-4-phosphate dehydrogenase PdxA [Roseomonas gilardii subsp. gilardii]|uniref:4-hydroxythreonine-4-phosphate dehydrogenase PdxA n=1 Tax=Roseomonas gilardii TaxID=257708 RepID=UPI001FFAED74|nr:4-hydroxythreonine-4-phosphate dehydrogenase PdxA [Roseomonas gilardii]UPG71557.1 4-hydroxythreonine-4-phosphate dehydrogenase PdxA [Roseomonas gilardii subsp. gilardii]
MDADALPLALTMGDPAGIGGELTLAAWEIARHGEDPVFVALDDPARLAALAARLGRPVALAEVADPSEAAAIFPGRLPVLPVPLAAPVTPGRPDRVHAPAILASIETAVRLAQAGKVGGLVTNPISKASLYGAGFGFPGHTEYLGALTGLAEPPVMMLACPELRVVPVTIHVSLRRALEDLTTAEILRTGRVLHRSLRSDFGIASPRIAVAGLNPHAGEGGAMGHEEGRIVVPAIEALRAEGIDAFGPLPPDTMFTPRARAGYDAALCMYHDQALIPLKTLDMDGGVNVTLGLPVVRTSPDHGTAFDIAGRGIAEPGSLLAALRMAAGMAARRNTIPGAAP